MLPELQNKYRLQTIARGKKTNKNLNFLNTNERNKTKHPSLAVELAIN